MVLGQVCIPSSVISTHPKSGQVVTGASDGIGREYAIQLAQRGFNVLVVARNEAMLTALTDEIGAN